MRIDVVTIFPPYLDPLRLSLVGRAIERGDVDLRVHDLRAHTDDVHRTVDDSPYGGGPGMVMRPEPWGRALDAVLADPPDPGASPLLVVPSPSGRTFRQPDAADLAVRPWVVVACARYEGLDARVVEHYSARVEVREWSIGDYVLAGGEAAALVMLEAALRLRPGVLGNERSHADDSFAPGDMADLLEGPAYTRPPTWRGLDVPAVLRSGDHAAVEAWRRDQARARTAAIRPDLRSPPGDQ